MATIRVTRNKTSLRTPWLRGLAGGVLVAGSVVGVMLSLAEGQATQPVLVALGPLSPGERITQANTAMVMVPQDLIFGGYLSDTDRGGSLFLSAPVRDGELISRGATSAIALSESSIVSLALSIGNPDWLVAGAFAELWVQPPHAENSFSEPFILSPQVVVMAVSRDDGFAADSLSSQVDLLVARRDLPGVLHAIANGFHVSLTPSNGPG